MTTLSVPRIAAFVIPLLAALVAVALVACAPAPPALVGPVADGPGRQDLNPARPQSLRDGGDLRIPLVRMPANYNNLHVDGGSTEVRQVMWALMPRAFVDGASGGPELDRDYVVSAEVTSAAPQTITYVIHGEATWGNGRPITWEDFAAQAAAMNGADPRFQTYTLSGYREIERVERGETDKQVRVVLRSPVVEWQRLFSPLYPAETTRDPAVFNSGWTERPLLTAGPFQVAEVDQVGHAIVLTRNPRWWGEQPRMDRLIFLATGVDRIALLANGEIDWTPLRTVDDLQRARSEPGLAVRVAPEREWAHLTFNGAPGAVLADLAVRRAVARGIDRTALAERAVGLIAPPTMTGNHIYAVGSPEYRDNSDVLPYDPDRANAELDAAGWVRVGDAREKDGVPLRLRMPTIPGSVVPLVLRDQLRRIGVEVELRSVPPEQFLSRYFSTGDFDVIASHWRVTSTPLTLSELSYADNPEGVAGNNPGRVTTPEIRAAFRQALLEPDPAVRARLGNEIDRMVWEQAHSIPLYATPGAVGVRADLANWGAKGFGDWDYISVGWIR